MAQGAIFQTFDTDTLRESVRNAIDNIAPRDTPVLALLGTSNDFRLEYQGNHKYEWLTDTLRVRTGTVNNSGSVGSGDTSITLTDASKLKPGDVIKIGTEKIWVGAVNSTTNVISSLGRGWGSTTAAGHDDASTWTYLFSARLEGADSDDSPYTNPSRLYNESQIMHFEIEVTGTEQISPRYGIADQMAYQLAKVIGGRGTSGGDMLIDLNNTFYHGERVTRVGKSTAGGMGGLETFVTSNVYDASSLTGGALTYDLLMDMMQDQWEAGGMPTHLVMNATQKRKVGRLFDGFRQMPRTDTTGGFMIDYLETDFGTTQILLDRWCPSDRIYSIQDSTMGWITMRDWSIGELGQNGDYVEMQIVGEFGFVVINEEANAYIHTLATS